MFSISPVAFRFCGISVHWYGIMIALGVLAAVIIASRRESRLGFPRDTTLNVILFALPVAVIAARLYYVAFSWEYFRMHPNEILSIRNGGLAIYGGLIGGILTGAVYAHVKKLSVARLADLAAPSIAVGQAFGRWGNFFNQEAFGASVANDALHFFPLSVYIEAKGGWFYATFFYESIWCFLLCILLLTAERKKALLRPGDCMLWYVLGYAAERTAVEGLRTDSLYLSDIRISQLLSAMLLLAAALILIYRLRKIRYISLLLPSAVLLMLVLLGRAPGFALTVLLSALQILFSLYSYYIIRKKASIP